MFKLFSRSKSSDQKFDFSSLRVDMHSHLLPGIDDGSPDVATSLQLIRGMAELGYTKLITTPHIMWDMYKNTHEIVLRQLEVVRTAMREENIAVELHAGAEYFLDDHVEQLLKKNEPLLTISGNMVLTEFSLAYPAHSLKDILFEMQMQGYQPVIAHPERYIYLEKNRDFYDELKDIGCLFQLNILSFANYYGKAPNELAQYLMKKGYYDLIGTDLHHARHLEALQQGAFAIPFKKLLDTGKIRNASL
jgi:protein-tyrosine phosphatase